MADFRKLADLPAKAHIPEPKTLAKAYRDYLRYRLTLAGPQGAVEQTRDVILAGKVVAVLPVNDESQVLIITNQGKMIRVETKGIRKSGRSTQGVTLIDTSDGDMVASASLIERQQDATDETTN